MLKFKLADGAQVNEAAPEAERADVPPAQIVVLVVLIVGKALTSTMAFLDELHPSVVPVTV